MSVEIRLLTLGSVSTNCYIVADSERKEAIVIDPVDDAPFIQQTAREAGWDIRYILATHAHFDHVLASKALKELTNAPFWIHKDCVPWLKTLPTQGRMFGMGDFPEGAEPDRFLTSEPEVLQIAGLTLETRYTPGHAAGHLAFYMPETKVVFSGDALFAGSIGRTDLPGGNYNLLMESIFKQLMTLDDDVQVLSGHGEPTTIGRERRSNLFLRDYDHDR